jgi:hypothetical protein
MLVKLLRKFILITALFIGVVYVLPVFASTTDGTINSTYKYAWGENIGWVNFGANNSIVHITDAGLSGSALSENIGWINLDNVANDGEGNLSGYGWGENVGWINFDPTNGGVVINSSGELTGSALGENVGWIIFGGDYKVKTDWRPRSARPACNNSSDYDGDGKTDYPNDPGCSSLDDTDETDPVSGGGGMSVAWSNPPVAPVGGFSVVINNNAEYTTALAITLNLRGGSDTARMAISNFADFRNAGQENYTSTKTWDLCKGLSSCPEGEYKVYVKFYTSWGQSSEIVLDTIIYQKEKPIIEKIQEIPKKITEEIKKISNFLEPLVPEFLKPNQPEVEPPEVPTEELVPEEIPLTFQNQWQLLPLKTIGDFVLAPLPNEIKKLVEKFPELAQTLEKIGITKLADLEKLQTVKLTLPGLTEKIGFQEGLGLTTAIPVAKLSATAKTQIPSEIVFAKTGGELIDFNIALSIDEKGEPTQGISTISGQPLQLVVKPDSQAKSVRGYVVFKSRETATDYQNKTIGKAELGKLKTLVLNRGEIATTTQDKKFGIMSREVAANIYDPNKNVNLVLSDNEQGQVLGVAVGEEIEERLVLQEFFYNDDDNDGIYTAEIVAPVVEGEYDIITIIDYEIDGKIVSKEILMRTVVDPEGYVFEKIEDKELRLPKVKVTIYHLNQAGQYELWLAKEYNQENPQITDVTGKYSFLVPPGKYYLTAEVAGYANYQGESFEVSEGPGVHFNIELKTKHWYLKIVDWKTIALLVLFALVAYNFYKDKKRKKIIKIN